MTGMKQHYHEIPKDLNDLTSFFIIVFIANISGPGQALPSDVTDVWGEGGGGWWAQTWPGWRQGYVQSPGMRQCLQKYLDVTFFFIF